MLLKILVTLLICVWWPFMIVKAVQSFICSMKKRNWIMLIVSVVGCVFFVLILLQGLSVLWFCD
jgi:uncharacterized membrane protein (DUF373 family)